MIESPTVANNFFFFSHRKDCLHHALPVGFDHSVFTGPLWYISYFILETEDTKVKIKSTERRNIYEYMKMSLCTLKLGVIGIKNQSKEDF